MGSAAIDTSDLRYPEWLVTALGVLGVIAFMLMLSPQVLLNHRRRSTKGMSVGLIVMWHVGSLLATAYYAALPEVAVFGALGLSVFSLFCGIVEAQAFAYKEARMSRKSSDESTDSMMHSLSSFFTSGFAAPSWLRFLVAFMAITLSGVVFDIGLVFLFKATPAEVSFVVGNLASAVLWAVAFLPQMREFIVTRDITGYSFAVSAIDVTGCTANVIILFAPRGASAAQALTEGAPFVAIVVMHSVLVLTALLVVCLRPKGVAASEKCGSAPNTEGAV